MKAMRLLLLLLPLLLAACGAGTRETTPTGGPTAPPDAGDSLADTQWRLVSFGAAGAESPVAEGSSVTLEFGADGRAGGTSGCNSYGSDYQVEGSTLTFGEIVSTAIACEDASVMDQEAQYLAALRTAGTFELADDRLTIQYNDGQGVLNFERAGS